MILRFIDFINLTYKLFKWCMSGRPGAFFVVDTQIKKISDFYRKPTSVEEVRQGVWVSTTDAANRGVIGVREGTE